MQFYIIIKVVSFNWYVGRSTVRSVDSDLDLLDYVLDYFSLGPLKRFKPLVLFFFFLSFFFFSCILLNENP